MNDKEIIPADDMEEMDVTPFIDYLKTKNGHEIASIVITIFEDLKNVTLDLTADSMKLEKLIQVFLVLLVIVSVVAFTILDKFNSSFGVLFGTLFGSSITTQSI